jgi:di/tricarboxylate transporter
LIGKTLGELEFRSRFHVSVLAIRHRGERVTANLGKQTLDFGDTLLVAGAWADIRRLWADDRDFVMLTLPAEYHELLPARERAPVAIGILIVMVVVMAFEFLPNSASALLAALAMVATGCVKLDAIYRIISWKTVVLIGGMLPLATALMKTGATGPARRRWLSRTRPRHHRPWPARWPRFRQVRSGRVEGRFRA